MYIGSPAWGVHLAAGGGFTTPNTTVRAGENSAPDCCQITTAGVMELGYKLQLSGDAVSKGYRIEVFPGTASTFPGCRGPSAEYGNRVRQSRQQLVASIQAPDSLHFVC